MMRAIVFLAVGPIAVFVATYWIAYYLAAPAEITFVTAMIAFYLSLPITVLAGIVDGCLALLMSRFLKGPPVAAAGAAFLRAPLTAAAGALVAHGPLTYQLYGPELRFWTLVVAAYAGICSLLSTDWLAVGRRIEDWAARN